MSGFFSANVTSPFPDPERAIRCRQSGERGAGVSEQPTAHAGPTARSDRSGPRAGRASCGWAAEHQRPGGARAGVCAGGRGAAVAGLGEVCAADAARREYAADAGQPDHSGPGPVQDGHYQPAGTDRSARQGQRATAGVWGHGCDSDACWWGWRFRQRGWRNPKAAARQASSTSRATQGRISSASSASQTSATTRRHPART